MAAANASADGWSEVCIGAISVINHAREISQVSNAIQEFRRMEVNMPPVFSDEHKKQIRDTYTGFQEMLMKIQKFLTTLILVARGQRSAASIDAGTIKELEQTVLNLTNSSKDLILSLEENLKKQGFIKLKRNGGGVVTVIGVAALIVEVKALYDGSSLKQLGIYLGATIMVTLMASCWTVLEHYGLHKSELSGVINNLKVIQTVLVRLSRNYPQIEAMISNLSDEGDTKQELTKLLEDTEAEVKKGFTILENS